MLQVHHTAVVGQNVSLGKNVRVGAYAILEDDIVVGNGTVIAAHAVLKGGTVVGNDCFIDNFAAIGGTPQDLSFDTETSSGVIIGNNVSIREHVTIHRAVENAKHTRIGDACMVQSGVHVAHDCEIGEGTVMGNGAMLGGRVKIGRKCFIGGGAAIHQHVMVGDGAILRGNSAIALNIPPYTMTSEAATVVGINVHVLRATRILPRNILRLKECFVEFYGRVGFFSDRAKSMLEEGHGDTPETENFLKFFLIQSKRGFAPKRHKI